MLRLLRGGAGGGVGIILRAPHPANRVHLQRMKMNPPRKAQLSYGEETINPRPWTDLASDSPFLSGSWFGQVAEPL